MKYYINLIRLDENFKTYETLFYKSLFNKNEFTNLKESLKYFNIMKENNNKVNYKTRYNNYALTILFNENNEIIKNCCYDLINKKYINNFDLNKITLLK